MGTVYSSPVAISATSTLQAIAYASGYTNSSVTSGVYTINGACATPTFSSATGTYTSAQSVTISTTTGGASINYTTNGTTPSSTLGTLYSSPVAISSDTTLQAIAYKSGLTNSAVASAVYTMSIPVTYTTDTSTEGSWWSSGGGYIYGSKGYVLCAWNSGTDVSSLSGSYVSSVTPSGQTGYCWGTGQPSSSATINPSTDTRNAACWYTSTNESVSIVLTNPNDGVAHKMAVYCLDWDNSGRTQTVDVQNPWTSTTLLSGGAVAMSSFNNGTWLVFTFYGNVKLVITHTSGGANAVISALAFN